MGHGFRLKKDTFLKRVTQTTGIPILKRSPHLPAIAKKVVIKKWKVWKRIRPMLCLAALVLK